MSALYLDSSAIVKLVAAEAESVALFAFIQRHEEQVSSVLSRVEVHRALRRLGATAGERRRADRILGYIALQRIDDPIVTLACQLLPSDLRSLDAIHVATALSAGDAVAGIVTYDDRLAKASATAGLEVYRPA